MKKDFKKLFNKFISPLGISVERTSSLNYYKTNSENYKIIKPYSDEFKFILKYPANHLSSYFQYRENSKAQLKQDLFVLGELDFKKNGYFVEFGATNGISLSNTFLLEKEFQWKGILAEPARCWHSELEENRNIHIEKNCVWLRTGESLSFKEAAEATLSTIDGYGEEDLYHKSRNSKNKYSVNTISLIDLLKKFNAPSTIDYISIDTEGSEYEILENFDFDKYKFRVMTIEHNYTSIREKIYRLLTSNGYVRVKEDLSLWDDWYVLKN